MILYEKFFDHLSINNNADISLLPLKTIQNSNKLKLSYNIKASYRHEIKIYLFINRLFLTLKVCFTLDTRDHLEHFGRPH